MSGATSRTSAPSSSRWRRLAPLVLATMASQALLVVLSPTITAIGDDFHHSIAAVGQARSVTAAVAIAASLAITARIGVIGVRRLIVVGCLGSFAAAAAVALAPNLGFFLAAHVLVALSFACLLSAGFAGVVGFPPEERAWAVGFVAGANALAWVIVNPAVGAITEWASWRLAELVPAVLVLAALVAVPFAGEIPGARRPTPLALLVRRPLGPPLDRVGDDRVRRVDRRAHLPGRLLHRGARRG